MFYMELIPRRRRFPRRLEVSFINPENGEVQRQSERDGGKERLYLLTYLLTYSMVQSPSWEANWFCSYSRNSPHFTEPEGSLPATCKKLSPEESSHMWVFLNNFYYREGLLAPRPTPKLEDHPSSAVRDCLFNLFAATQGEASPVQTFWNWFWLCFRIYCDACLVLNVVLCGLRPSCNFLKEALRFGDRLFFRP